MCIRDRGGIILLGKAPTNRPLDPAPTIEGGVGRQYGGTDPVSYTHLRAHETVLDLVCRLLLEKKKKNILY